MRQSGTPRVRIIHETNPQKYFPALFELERRRLITITGTHRYSVVKEWIRAWAKDRKPLRENTVAAIRDAAFRLRIPAIRNEVIILGFAPWDWRMIIFSALAPRNTIIYHTSWPHWSLNEVPRRYGPATSVLRAVWLRFLRHPNVHVVAVLDASRAELLNRYGIPVKVIPHAVPSTFFRADHPPESDSGQGVRLIYVGGLIHAKGINELLQLMESLRGEPVELTIVGDGPLKGKCSEAAAGNPAIRFLGPISDRSVLADTMASHDVLVLLSQQELFGIVIAEAMAAGLGVVATDNIGPHSILHRAGLGNLFAVGDLEGPRQLVRRLASDSSQLQLFRAEHGEIAREFRLDDVANLWADVIDSTGRQPS